MPSIRTRRYDEKVTSLDARTHVEFSNKNSSPFRVQASKLSDAGKLRKLICPTNAADELL